MSESLKSTPNTDRRKFLKSASIAGGILASGLPKVHAASSEVIRVGLIGCGGRGTGAAVNAMEADPAVRIVALADLFGASMQSCRSSLSKRNPDQFVVTDETCFEGFDGYKKLLDSGVDVVLLASPPHYRPDHIEASVDAGKQIFCEKPVATDAVGVRRVEAACKKADEKGLNVVSGLCWRYAQGMKETIAQIHDGRLGTIVSTQTNYLTSPLWIRPRKPDESEMEYQCRNWYYFNWLSGDHIVEQHIHSLDKMLWLHHDVPPVKAYGLGGRQLRNDVTQGDIYDHFSVVFEWADGTRTFAYTRQMAGCFNQTEDFVYGTEGVARLVKHQIEGGKAWKFRGKEVQMHQAEQNEFFKAIRGERERINNGDYMCRSTLMAILGREVCYSGQELAYEQVATSNQDLSPKQYAWGDAPPVDVPQPGSYRFPG
ncbi:Gfo/Idh/MocA family protein [Rubripirellula tenax]|nr:Gfo/Idh/MocA family oxidoreductase [Rubripirellula tenax]